MDAGDGDDCQDDQAESPEAREQAERETNRAEYFEPGCQEPADLDRHDVEWKRKIILNVSEPVVAVVFRQAGATVLPRQNQTYRQQCNPVSGRIEKIDRGSMQVHQGLHRYLRPVGFSVPGTGRRSAPEHG